MAARRPCMRGTIALMPRTSRIRRLTVVSLLLATSSVVALPSAQAASYKSCDRISNPYAGSRYEGVDLRNVRALKVSCRTSRRVVRGAHRKALGLTPPPSGIRSFRWRRWSVTGNIRGSTDRYVAKSGGRRVRWVF